MTSRIAAIAVAVLALVLSVVAIAAYRADLAQREVVRAFFTEYTHDVRRPLVADTIDYAPRADWLAGIAADAVLQDVYGAVDLDELEPDVRQAWIEIVARTTDEAREVRGILLDALRTRPGWALHAGGLGQIEYTLTRADAEEGKWRRPVAFATSASPGSDALAVFLAAGDMEQAAFRGRELTPTQRASMTRAFQNAAFLQAALPTAVALVGTEDALALVPDEPQPLRTAFSHFVREGEVTTAASILSRWQKAEWASRAAEMEEIESLASLGDRTRILGAVRQWASRHPAREFGSRASAQLVRLLELWPDDDPGQWRRDPRGEIVRVLLALDGRAPELGEAVLGAVRQLDGTPETVRAEALLAAGRIEDAERFARQSDTAGTLSWTDFWAHVAIAWTARGDEERARDALAEINPVAREECEARLARGVGELGDPPLRFSRAGDLPVCIGPSEERDLVVRAATESPALLAIGWNGTAESWPLVDSGTAVRIPLGDRRGREILTVRTIAGSVDGLEAAWVARSGEREPQIAQIDAD
ncbi:MAG: hypothetical protein ACRD2J_16285 [Thermoanaerobaculia bacterium]